MPSAPETLETAMPYSYTGSNYYGIQPSMRPLAWEHDSTSPITSSASLPSQIAQRDLASSARPSGPSFLGSSISIPDDVGSPTRTSSRRENHYICLSPGCSKIFLRPFDLDRHMKTHYPDNSKRFDCPEAAKGSWCGRIKDRGFTRQDHLREHVRKVHGLDIRKGAKK